MLLFLLLNSLVLFSAIKIAERFFDLEYIYDRILGIFILCLAQIVITCQILGLANILDVNWLFFLNIIIVLFVWVTSHKRPAKTIVVDKSFNELFFNNKVILFCTAAILGFGMLKIFVNLINPPFGWDSLNYHFTFPVEWLKNKSFYTPPTICDDPTPTYYPINGGIFYFWLIAPFKDVFLADLGQVPFLLISFIAIFSFSRKMQVSSELSFYAAGLFLIMPNVFKNIEIAYADIFVVALFLIALNFLYYLNKRCNIKNIILVSISLGLLLGTKTVATPYVGLIVLFSLYVLFKNTKKLGSSKLILYIFIFSILIICLGGFGYIRNFLIAGNPLYPFQFKILGKIIFNGPMPRATYQAHWSTKDYNLLKLLFSEGFGPQLFLLIVPAILLVPILAIKKRLRTYDLFEKFIFVLPIILYLIFRYGIPQLWTRFLYPFMAVGLVVSVYGLSRLNISYRIIRIAIFVFFIASIAELSGHAELIWSLLLAAISFFVIPKLVKYFVGKRKLLIGTVCIFAIFALVCFKLMQINYLNNEFKRYSAKVYGRELTEGWKWLNDNTYGENIAYTGRPLPFPLYGSQFKNNVYYVSINYTEPAWLHRFPKASLIWDAKYENLHSKLREKGNYRADANVSAWKQNLSNKDIDYLIIYPLHQTDMFPVEDIWASSEPNNFKLVFSNSQMHVYRVESRE